MEYHDSFYKINYWYLFICIIKMGISRTFWTMKISGDIAFSNNDKCIYFMIEEGHKIKICFINAKIYIFIYFSLSGTFLSHLENLKSQGNLNYWNIYGIWHLFEYYENWGQRPWKF